jgi:integrase
VNGYVFPGARNSSPLSDVAMLRALQRMGRGDLTVHGFRSTFSDWCRETTRFAPEIRKMALAHTLGDKVEEAYSRGDLFRKRRQVMDAWANYIDRSSANGTVVPLAQKAVSSA